MSVYSSFTKINFQQKLNTRLSLDHQIFSARTIFGIMEYILSDQALLMFDTYCYNVVYFDTCSDMITCLVIQLL